MPSKTRSRNPSAVMILKLLLFLTSLILLAACTSQVKLPYVAQIDELDAPKVRWSLKDSICPHPSLTLTDSKTAKVLAHVRSVFDDDWVASMGKPEGDSISTFRSPTNNTIVVHECASESSPNEHLAIFAKEGGSDAWPVRSAFPPHQPGPLYGHYGVTRGVDDHYLYYQFPDGILRRIELESLSQRDMTPP